MWLKRCRDWLAIYDPINPWLNDPLNHYSFMRMLSDYVADDAIIVSDTGGNQIMMGHCWRSKRGQRIFSSNGNSAMGFSMAACIGASFAQPERQVICIIGDGGMQLNIQELQTIAYHELPIKIFILNNKILGNTRAWQIQNEKSDICCSPSGGYSSPSFCSIAKAYGIEAMSLGEWERFDYVVGNALASDKAVVVDVVHENFCDYQPRMTLWNAGVEEMYPTLPDDEFLANMTVAPLLGWQERKLQYKEIK